MAIEVQKRDAKILKMVFACRVASYSQIANRCFGDLHKTIAYRRIRKLCDNGLLQPKIAVSDKFEDKYLEATEKSWKHIQELWSFVVDRPHFKSESPVHDLRLNEIVFRLEKLKTFRAFYTENLLQSSSALAQDKYVRDLVNIQADGALFLNGPDGKIYVYGVEFESSKKAPERYRDKLSAYYLARGISGVIYICSEQEIVSSLVRIDKELREDRRSILHFGFENEVLESRDKIVFKNAKEHAIELY